MSAKSEKKKQEWLKIFGKYIRTIRLERSLTGSDFGALINMEKGNVSRLEAGKINPSTYALKQICDGLDLTLEEFWNGFMSK